MKKHIIFIPLIVIGSFILSYFGFIQIIKPIFSAYPRLMGIYNRSQYSSYILFIFEFLSIACAFIQIYLRKISVYYVYLFYPVYILLLFILLFVKTADTHAMVINPLHDDYFGSPLALKEAILNLAAFIPFGVLYYRTTQLQMAILTLLTITGIETIQYVFNVGVFSTGDIILNFIGCLIGYRIARILQKRLLKNQSSFH